MPLYEYRCQKCEAEFELLVRNEKDRVCPKCQSRDLEKLLSVPASPSIHSGSLPVTLGEDTCGRPQCARGCMFDN